MLFCVAIGFALSTGTFTRYDLLAIAFYAGIAAFAWHPVTAAFTVMLISCVGVVFSGSGGDLLDLAIALSLVVATCVPWIVVAHVVLLGALTTHIAISGSTLAQGGVYGIAGIAVIAFFMGLAFRLVSVRESSFVAERARAVKEFEEMALKDQERIADELHDGIAHDLTLIVFHARIPVRPLWRTRGASDLFARHPAQGRGNPSSDLGAESRSHGADGGAAPR